MVRAHPIPVDPRFLNHTGQRFGRLVVLSYAGRATGGTRWNCVCDCGTATISAGGKLRGGQTKSCGCLCHELLSKFNKTHGQRWTRLYSVWRTMKARCLRKNVSCFPDYGGRGITVCGRWRDSFAAFLADMGPEPSLKHTIERRNNNRGYEPDNCYWATPKQQGRNKRNNRVVTAKGKTQCLSAWEEELGLRSGAVSARIARGMDPALAVTKPRMT